MSKLVKGCRNDQSLLLVEHNLDIILSKVLLVPTIFPFQVVNGLFKCLTVHAMVACLCLAQVKHAGFIHFPVLQRKTKHNNKQKTKKPKNKNKKTKTNKQINNQHDYINNKVPLLL